MSDEEQKPKKDEGGGGAPLWMCTFADMMSLLLAFFVLLFSFSSIDDKKYTEVGGSLKEAFGVQVLQEAVRRVLGINMIAMEFSSGRPNPNILAIVPPDSIVAPDPQRQLINMKDVKETTDAATEGEMPKREEIDEKLNSLIKQETVAKKLAGEMGVTGEPTIEPVKIEEKTEESPLTEKPLTESDLAESSLIESPLEEVKTDKSEVEGLEENQQGLEGSQQEDIEEQAQEPDFGQQLHLLEQLSEEVSKGLLDVEVQGEKIVFRINEKGSFASGSAELMKPFEPVLEKVSNIIAALEGTVEVAGHTDNVPISTGRFRSNWELSSSRAVTVVHKMIDIGDIESERFEVQGFAETQPLAGNETSDGRAKNRRVEITVTKKTKRPIKPRRKRAVKDRGIAKWEKEAGIKIVRNEEKPAQGEKSPDEDQDDLSKSINKLSGIGDASNTLSSRKFDPIFQNDGF